MVALRAMQQPPLVAAACFHWQQAAEKALKAFLVAHNDDPPRTHDLVRLLRRCESRGLDAAELIDDCAELSRHAVAGRYPDEPDPLPEGTDVTAEAAARRVVAAVLGSLPPEVSPERCPMVMAELSVVPIGAGESVSGFVAEILKVIDAAGITYRLTAMGTILEGPWDEVMRVVDACYRRAEELADRVYLVLKLDGRRGEASRLDAKVEAVVQQAGRPLQTG